MPGSDTQRCKASLHQLVADMGELLQLIDAADPADYGRLQALTEAVKAALRETAEGCAAQPEGAASSDQEYAACCAAIVAVRARIEASRWDARPNRDFEDLLRESRAALESCARDLGWMGGGEP